MNEPTRYLVTVNGVNVGTFNTLSEADTQGVKACSMGIAGPHEMNKPKVIEIRDSRTFQLLGRRTM
jgi:hypothetical protein